MANNNAWRRPPPPPPPPALPPPLQRQTASPPPSGTTATINAPPTMTTFRHPAAPLPAPAPSPPPPPPPRRGFPPPPPPLPPRQQQNGSLHAHNGGIIKTMHPPPSTRPSAGMAPPLPPQPPRSMPNEMWSSPPPPSSSWAPASPRSQPLLHTSTPQQQQRMLPPPPPPPFAAAAAAGQYNVAVPPPPLPPPGTFPPMSRPPPPPSPIGGATPWRRPPPPPPPPMASFYPSQLPQPPHYPTPPQQQQQQQQQQQELPRTEHVPLRLPRPTLFSPWQNNRAVMMMPPVYHTATGYHPNGSSSSSSSAAVPPPPPPAADDGGHVVLDNGNASPELLRATLYYLPATRGLWQHVGGHDAGLLLPLGILCTPLALPPVDHVPRDKVLPHDKLEPWHGMTDNIGVPVVNLRVAAAAAASSSSNDGATNDGCTASLPPPPRCASCQAYVNTYWNQKESCCNFCGARSSASWGLFGGNNMVASSPSSSSLPLAVNVGTMEYVVDGPYVTRTHAPPVTGQYTVVAVDLTSPQVARYVSILQRWWHEVMTQHERQQMDGGGGGDDGTNMIPPPPSPRLGLCFVASCGVFVPVHGRYHVMADVTEDPFCPVPLDTWTFTGTEAWDDYCQQLIAHDLAALQALTRRKNNHGRDGLECSCGGAALAFLVDALQHVGGRGLWWTHRRPNFGVGAVAHRARVPGSWSSSSPHDNDNDVRAYLAIQHQSPAQLSGADQAAAKFYKELAARAQSCKVTLDVMYHTTAAAPFLDIATLGELCRATCGAVTWIRNNTAWESAVQEELRRRSHVYVGWDAVLKVRCSAGVQVKSILATAPGKVVDGLGSAPELELNSVWPGTCIALELEHRVGGVPKEHTHVYIQSALLYTTPRGQRRVRVSTLALPVARTVPQVWRGVDFGGTAALLLRSTMLYLHKAAVNEPGGGNGVLKKTRDMLYHKLVHMLVQYKKQPGMSAALLPERLQLLPLFCMAAFKSPLLQPTMHRRSSGSHDVVVPVPSANERAYLMVHAGLVRPCVAFWLVHPVVLDIMNIASPEIGTLGNADSESPWMPVFVHMPAMMDASMEALQDDAVYLVASGLACYLYIGRDVPADVRAQLEKDEHDPNSLLRRVLWQLRTWTSTHQGSESDLRPTVLALTKVTQRDEHQSVLDLMVYDAIGGERDYAGFMADLQRQVQASTSATK